MGHGFVAAQVHRTSRNLLIVCGVILAGVTVLSAKIADYAHNAFAGPFAVPPRALLDDVPDPRREYLQVTFDRVADTGLLRHVTRNGVDTGAVAERYYAAFVGGRVVLVEADATQTGPTFLGELRPLTNRQSEVIARLVAKDPRAAGKFAMVYFSARPYAADAWAGIFLLGVAGCGGLFGLGKGLTRVVNPMRHPVYRNLAAIGDVEKLEEEIGKEIAAKPRELGKARFTSNWTLFCSAFTFRAVRTSELLWVYRTANLRWVHGIPAGRDHYFVLCDRHGTKLTIRPGNGAMSRKLVEAYEKMAPWVAVGNGWRNAWRWNRRRKEMAAEADATKARLNAPTAPPLAA
jgi:hypothetical protein